MARARLSRNMSQQLSASSSSASSFILIEIFAASTGDLKKESRARPLHCGRSETLPHSYAFALASRNPAPQIRARRAAASCKNTHTTTEEEERGLPAAFSFLFALQCLLALSQQQHQGRAITHSSHTHILTPRSHPTTTTSLCQQQISKRGWPAQYASSRRRCSCSSSLRWPSQVCTYNICM